MSSLASLHCEAKVDKVEASALAGYLAELPGWSVSEGLLVKRFDFKNYYETMAFVNVVAWVAHREDHHPDLEVGYNRCRVSYSTHSIGGLSRNDFICAARIEAALRA
jgi:4a-hydroxytetrahydrobiopterin dehydratase